LFAKDCIESSIPFIRLNDKAYYVLELMQEYKTDTLVIVDEEKVKGIVTEKTLLELDDDVMMHQLINELPVDKILDDLHIFDVLKKCALLHNYYLPVVSTDNYYIGITSPHKILQNLSGNSAISTEGGILIIEMDAKDYSLTEISRIVESNNAQIIQSLLAKNSSNNLMQVSIKINREDLKDIQASFERYNFNVIAVYHESEFEYQLQERYEGLMKYLEV
jgi:predicted transcriptional regulator